MPELIAAEPNGQAANDAVGLAGIDAAIAAKSWSLSFAAPLEARFEAETRDARLRYFHITAYAAVALYDIFIINDWLLLHDRVGAMAVARLGIFTPTAFGLIWASKRWRSAQLREWAAAASAALGVLLPMAVMLTSASPNKLVYQSGSLLVMMFATVIQRVRFVPAVASMAVMLAIQVVVVGMVFDTQTFAATTTFYATATILLLMTVYVAEKADRRAFMLAMRGRLLHDELTDLANRDALTRLFNRRYLDETARDLWAAPQSTRAATILLDIDHFKLFNDSNGHLAGDECLRKVSACVKANAAGGLAFRFGGEEILVLLPGSDLARAIAAAETIRKALTDAAIPHPALGRNAIVTASFGAASVKMAEATMTDLVAEADQALYLAKRAGRNCVRPLAWRQSLASPNEEMLRLSA